MNQQPAVNQQRSISRLQLVLLLPVVSGLMAAPWLVEQLVWCEWLATAIVLVVNCELSRSGQLQRWRWLAFNWIWAAAALGLAFYWSPAAMAYSMDASYGIGVAVTIPIILWDAARIAIPVWVGVRMLPRIELAWLPVSMIAVLMESVLPAVFPWRLGYSQSAWAWTFQLVEYFGPSFGTVMVFAYGSLLAVIVLRIAALMAPGHNNESQVDSVRPAPKRRWQLEIALLLLCVANSMFGLWSIGSWRESLADMHSVRVALVQVDPSFVSSHDEIKEVTNSLPSEQASKPDLVCWPESTAGNYDEQLSDLSSWEKVFPMSMEPERGKQPWPSPMCPLLVGGKTFEGDLEDPSALRVAAFLIDTKEQIQEKYYKRYLMPFGEYIPLADRFPAISEYFPMSEDVDAGTEASTLRFDQRVQIGALLCYEDMLPAAVHGLVDNGANLLVGLVNGSAFESSTTRYQHRKLAQFRAVEFRRTLVRSAATGETCVISPTGEIVARLPIEQAGYLLESVPICNYQTWYARFPRTLETIAILGLLLTVGAVRMQP